MRAFVKKEDQVMREKALIAGLEKHIDDRAELVLDGRRYTPEELASVLRERVRLTEEVAAAKAAWLTAIRRERDHAEKTSRLVSVLKRALHVMFGVRDDVLADFGMDPHKTPRALTGVEKKAMVAKILATRAARHTMGKRQREGIVGIVDAAVP